MIFRARESVRAGALRPVACLLLATSVSACVGMGGQPKTGSPSNAAWARATPAGPTQVPFAASADPDRSATDRSTVQVLRRAHAPWIGSSASCTGHGERLPEPLTEPVLLEFDDAASGGRVSLRSMAERLASAVDVPFRLAPDVPDSTESRVPPERDATALPAAGGDEPRRAGREAMKATVAMRWSGSIEGYLDQVANQLGLAWKYRDGAVVIERTLSARAKRAGQDAMCTAVRERSAEVRLPAVSREHDPGQADAVLHARPSGVAMSSRP